MRFEPYTLNSQDRDLTNLATDTHHISICELMLVLKQRMSFLHQFDAYGSLRMFKLHFNETVNYIYETIVIVKFSLFVPSLTHYIICVSPWSNGRKLEVLSSNLAWGLVLFLLSYLNIMFKLHFNETVNYIYETLVRVKFSLFVPSLIHYIVCAFSVV